jgi:acyl-CoA reductase-like NAD-dependent aldehyde dehydrogenase
VKRFDPFAGQIYAGGDFYTPAGTPLADVVNPSNLTVSGRIARCTPADIRSVVALSNSVQPQWAALDAVTRAQMLHDVATAISGDQGAVAALLTAEVGKPHPESLGELAVVPGIFHYYAELARHDAGSIAGPIQTGTFQFKRYEPFGVSAHIIPFNYPLLILAFTVAASLAAGNSVIIKPSEVSSLSTLKFMENFAGLPQGVVSCVTGDDRTGAHLVEDEGTDVVAFTGSVAAARQVNLACAARMKPCIIEAGGNDALIVSAEIDPDFAAAAVTCAAFHLSGQICTSSERIFVVDEIHDTFVDHLVQRVRALRVGDGFGKVEIGPMATEKSRNRIDALVKRAIADGAVLRCGGRIPPHLETGWFYEPTVLTGIEPDAEILNGEVFGPVAPICRVGSVAEGVALANRSRYGLGASILTTRMDEAMYAINNLEAGMVWVNNPLVDNVALPFGGRKMSGIGRELGSEGLNAFRQPKTVTLDAVPRLHDWWYPYPDSAFCRGIATSADGTTS